MEIELSWCPTCREWSSADTGARCAWCDTPTVRKRGGWTRHDRRRFTRRQVEAIHAAHMNGASLRQIARTIMPRFPGVWSSEGSCVETLRVSLRREGLTVRGQGAATAAANRARSTRLPGEDKNAYKRRARRERGYRDSRTGEWRRAKEVV